MSKQSDIFAEIEPVLEKMLIEGDFESAILIARKNGSEDITCQVAVGNCKLSVWVGMLESIKFHMLQEMIARRIPHKEKKQNLTLVKSEERDSEM